MKNEGKFADLPSAEQVALLEKVRCIPLFANLDDKTNECLRQADVIDAESGDCVLGQEQAKRYFWILVEGGLRAEYVEPDGTRKPLATHHGCETFGEVPLLTGSSSRVECTMIEPSRLLRVEEDSFWQLMTTCPSVRKGILNNLTNRQQGLQGILLQREKMASLGTMAAGLMHELNNPGSAAKRASTQLRESLTRLQELNLRNCRMGLASGGIGLHLRPAALHSAAAEICFDEFTRPGGCGGIIVRMAGPGGSERFVEAGSSAGGHGIDGGKTAMPADEFSTGGVDRYIPVGGSAGEQCAATGHN